MTLKNICDAILKADPDIKDDGDILGIVSADTYFLVKFSKEYRKGLALPSKVWPALRSLGGIAKTRMGRIRSIKIPKY